jgi:GNAT superfamily N-acetyltransferase
MGRELKEGRGRALGEELQVGRDLPVSPEEVVALRQAVGWPTAGNYERILAEDLFHISARLRGRLVGFAQVVGSPHGDLLLHDVCVHPDLQRKGVGTRLVETVLRVCSTLSPQGLNVLFEEKNLPFFRRFGFRILHGGYMDSPTLAKISEE